jgi:hypothetical protein
MSAPGPITNSTRRTLPCAGIALRQFLRIAADSKKLPRQPRRAEATRPFSTRASAGPFPEALRSDPEIDRLLVDFYGQTDCRDGVYWLLDIHLP